MPDAVTSLIALAAFLAGLLGGFACFRLLGRTLGYYLEGRVLAGAASQAGRFLIVAAVLFASVRFGAGALLACAAGILAARHVVLRRMREPA